MFKKTGSCRFYYFLLILCSFNNSVFLSERETADRNYALTYYMKENKCFPKGFTLQDCLDFYFQVRRRLYLFLFVCLFVLEGAPLQRVWAGFSL